MDLEPVKLLEAECLNPLAGTLTCSWRCCYESELQVLLPVIGFHLPMSNGAIDAAWCLIEDFPTIELTAG